jgi:hypothetical protein
MRRLHSCKGQEFSVSVPMGELTARDSKEDKNDTEIPSPDNTIINNAKLQKVHRSSWEVKNIDRIDRIDSNKNTPDLRTLTTTQREWKNNLLRTAHKIHYRWNQRRMNGNKLRWKCNCSSHREKRQQNNRNNSKRLGSRIAHRLKFPAYYPPGRYHYNVFTI